MERRKYIITIKEVGKEEPMVTEYIGNTTTQGLIKWYGLDEPDVEWYDIKLE